MNGLIFIWIFYSQQIWAEPERSTKQESGPVDRPGIIIPTLIPRPTTKTTTTKKTTTTTTEKDCTPKKCGYYYIWDGKCDCVCGAFWRYDGILQRQTCRCEKNQYWDDKERTYLTINHKICIMPYTDHVICRPYHMVYLIIGSLKKFVDELKSVSTDYKSMKVKNLPL